MKKFIHINILRFFTFAFIVLAVFLANSVKAKTTNILVPIENALPSSEIVKCYPNPATTYINFNFENATSGQKYRLVIYSFTGKKMNDFAVNASAIRVDLSAYFRGVYVYQIIDSNGKPVDNGKFQVIK